MLLDAVMPRMNGSQAQGAIRKLQPSVRFLFSSGYAPEGLPEGLRASLTAPLLRKPYHLNDLLRAVRRALDGNNA